jgi:hypothetical protein
MPYHNHETKIQSKLVILVQITTKHTKKITKNRLNLFFVDLSTRRAMIPENKMQIRSGFVIFSIFVKMLFFTSYYLTHIVNDSVLIFVRKFHSMNKMKFKTFSFSLIS